MRVFGPSVVDQSLRTAVQECWMTEISNNPTVESVEATMRGRLDQLLRHVRTHPDWMGHESIKRILADAGIRDESSSELAGIVEGIASQFVGESPYGSLLFSARLCWMSLPADQRDMQSLERHMRRLMERILANNREDAEAFRFQGG